MLNNNTYPVLNDWAENMLLQWHRQDPVSAKETTRTDVVYSIQHNRNPFIDYPALVEYIWGNYSGVPWSGTVTETEEVNPEPELVYNTATHILQIYGLNDMNVNFSVYAVDGRLLQQANNIQATENINIHHQESGVYIIEVKTQRNIFLRIFSSSFQTRKSFLGANS